MLGYKWFFKDHIDCKHESSHESISQMVMTGISDLKESRIKDILDLSSSKDITFFFIPIHKIMSVEHYKYLINENQ